VRFLPAQTPWSGARKPVEGKLTPPPLSHFVHHFPAIRSVNRFSELIGRLSDEEFAQLYDSISRHGLRVPIVLSERGILLDGVHRLAVCHLLDIKPTFQSAPDSLSLTIELNLARRRVSLGQRLQIAKELLPFARRDAKLRKLKKLQNGPGATVDLTPNEYGRATEQVAKQVGVSRDTIEKFIKLTPELAAAVVGGTMKVHRAYEELKALKLAQLPSAKTETKPDAKPVQDTNTTLKLAGRSPQGDTLRRGDSVQPGVKMQSRDVNGTNSDKVAPVKKRKKRSAPPAADDASFFHGSITAFTHYCYALMAVAPIKPLPEGYSEGRTFHVPTEFAFNKAQGDLVYEIETPSMTVLSIVGCPDKALIYSPGDDETWYFHITDQPGHWEFESQAGQRIGRHWSYMTISAGRPTRLRPPHRNRAARRDRQAKRRDHPCSNAYGSRLSARREPSRRL
jgi:hypothetical protein